MDEQCLRRVANSGALHLGVHNHVDRHRDVRRLIHKHVADAVVVLEHRHRRLGHDAADQALSSSRDREIDPVGELEQVPHGVAVGSLDELDGVSRQVRASPS